MLTQKEKNGSKDFQLALASPTRELVMGFVFLLIAVSELSLVGRGSSDEMSKIPTRCQESQSSRRGIRSDYVRCFSWSCRNGVWLMASYADGTEMMTVCLKSQMQRGSPIADGGVLLERRLRCRGRRRSGCGGYRGRGRGMGIGRWLEYR